MSCARMPGAARVAEVAIRAAFIRRSKACVAVVSPTLVAGSLLTFAAGALYAVVGVQLALRARTAGHAVALHSLFWLGVAFFGITDGLWSLAVPLLDPPLAVGVTILHAKTLAGCAGFFGLLYYLTFLYTGGRRWLWPLLAFYVAVYVLVTYDSLAAQPIGQATQTWRSGLVYAHDSGLFGLLSTLALFVPPVVGAVAYARLLAHAIEPGVRARILTTSLALGVFFGGVALGWIVGFPWWPPVEKALGIGSGAALAWAQRG